MRDCIEPEGVVSELDLFQQLDGKTFTYWHELVEEVNAVVWINFPKFRVSSFFDVDKFARWAWERGWIAHNQESGFVIHVGT